MTAKHILTVLSAVLLSLAVTSAQQREGFVPHTVKWFEDLKSISARYGVPADVIVRVNSLKENKVYTRSVIWIPVSSRYWDVEVSDGDSDGTAAPSKNTKMAGKADAAIQAAANANAAATADSPVGGTDTAVGRNDGQIIAEAAASPYIPEKIEAQPTSNVSCTILLQFSNSIQDNNRTSVDRSLDFYSGALIAARKLAEECINVNITAFDLVKDNDPSQWESSDFILGPIRKEDLSVVLSQVSPETIVVSPLDQKAESLASEYLNMVQIPSPASAQWEDIKDWIKDEYTESQLDTAHLNYIIIGSSIDNATFQNAKACLDSAGIAYHQCTCNVQGAVSGWSRAYAQYKLNKVIIATSNEAVLNNAIRNMSVATSLGNVTVFCNNKIRSYETIPLEDIHHAEVHATCSYFIDYDDDRTRDFIHSYRTYFNAEPSQYAFQGYDLAYFLLKTRAKYGPAWKDLIVDEPRTDLLQSSIKLNRNADGALCNTAVRRVLYSNDYSLILK